MAPNTITMLGFLILFSQIPVFLLAEVMPFLGPIPFLYSAVVLFIYQTMDAVDGKQARKLGKSSPLGQFLDHGCDCVSMSLFVWNIYRIF